MGPIRYHVKNRTLKQTIGEYIRRANDAIPVNNEESQDNHDSGEKLKKAKEAKIAKEQAFYKCTKYQRGSKVPRSTEGETNSSEYDVSSFSYKISDIVAVLGKMEKDYAGRIIAIDERKCECTICFDDIQMQIDFVGVKSHSGLFSRVIESIPMDMIHDLSEHKDRYENQYKIVIIKHVQPLESSDKYETDDKVKPGRK